MAAAIAGALFKAYRTIERRGKRVIMAMRKTISMLAAVVRGGSSPREIATAVFLGVLAGFLTGWNASLAAVLLLVVILHASTRVFCQTWLASAAIAWLLTPVTFHAGYFLAARTRIGDAIDYTRDSLGLVMFDLDRYTLLGGIVVGLAVAAPITWLAIRAAGHLRQTLSIYGPHAEGRDPTELKGMTHAVCCYLYGPPPVAARIVARPRLSGKLRSLSTCVIVSGALAAAGLIGPELIEQRLLTRMSRANQAEVDAGQMRLSLWDGMLYIQDLRFADPEHLDRDRLQVGYATAVLRPGPLLRGQVRIERLLLEDIRADAPRNLRARPHDLLSREFEPVAATSEGARAVEAPQVEITDSGDEDGLPLAHYMQDWQTLGRRFDRLRLLIEQIERLSAVEATPEQAAASQPAGYAPLGYAQMRAMRCPFEHPAPSIAVAALRANVLPAEWGLGEAAALEITNLTTNPGLTGQPTTIEIVAPSLGAEVAIEMNLHRGGKKHLTRARTTDRNLTWLVNTSLVGRTMGVHGGRLNATAEGWLSQERIDLPLEIELTDLSVNVLPGQAVAGVSAETWNEALTHVDRVRTAAVLEGSWRSPHLFVDAGQLAHGYQRQLIAAGQPEIAHQMELAIGTTDVDDFPQAQASAEVVVEEIAAPEAMVSEEEASEAEQVSEEMPPLVAPKVTEDGMKLTDDAPSDDEPAITEATTKGAAGGADAQPTIAPTPAEAQHVDAPIVETPAAEIRNEPTPAAPVDQQQIAQQPAAPVAPPVYTGNEPFDPEGQDYHSDPGLNAGVGELRYPVTVANQREAGGQAPGRDDRPLVQDLVARRHEARMRLEQQHSERPDGDPAPIPGGQDEEGMSDMPHDDHWQTATQRRAPPPVSFEVGYDDQPREDDQPRDAESIEPAETSEGPIHVPSRPRARNLAGPKAVEPYGSDDGVPTEADVRQGSAIDRLSSGVKQMFSTSGKPRTNGRFSQQNNGPNQPNLATDDNGGAENSELPGIEDEPSRPKSKSKSKRKNEERQAARPKQADEDWYKFWK